MGTDRDISHDAGAVTAGGSVDAQEQLDLFGPQVTRGVDGVVASSRPAGPAPAHCNAPGPGSQMDIFWVEEDDSDIVWVAKGDPSASPPEDASSKQGR
jgi:hypothetical protein